MLLIYFELFIRAIVYAYVYFDFHFSSLSSADFTLLSLLIISRAIMLLR